MGTRHLIAIAKDNGYPLAQYGQWDGYLSGQGQDILDFFNNPEFDLATFKEKVGNLYYDSAEVDKIYEMFCSREGWMNMEEAAKFNASEWGYLSRDTGAKVLDIIMNSTKPMVTVDSITFAHDSLFCEWAYVIDLNRNVLEVYEGFNKEQVEPTQRFYKDTPDDSGYYSVKLVAEYPLNELPVTFEKLEGELTAKRDARYEDED